MRKRNLGKMDGFDRIVAQRTLHAYLERERRKKREPEPSPDPDAVVSPVIEQLAARISTVE